MLALYIYLFLCYILAIPIIWLYYSLSKGHPNIWEKDYSRGFWVKSSGKATWQAGLFFFALAPIFVPWWLILTIKVNRGA